MKKNVLTTSTVVIRLNKVNVTLRGIAMVMKYQESVMNVCAITRFLK